MFIGCSSEQETKAEESFAFHEKYESFSYAPEFQKRYLEALQENNIPYFEEESYSRIFVNTERTYSDQVSKIREKLFGKPRSKFSVSFLNKDDQKQAARILRESGIEIQIGNYFDDSYLAWKESDTELADEILLTQFGYDRERSIEAAKSHNK